jgi:hypothetical protein
MIRPLIIFLIVLQSCNEDSTKYKTMTIDEVLTKERTQYISTYKDGINMYDKGSSAIEVMLQITSDQNKSLPEIFQLHRFDLMVKAPNGKLNPTEFNLHQDSILHFEKQEYKINDIAVNIEPFVWNGCEFTFDKEPNNWDSFSNWAIKWIDLEDENKIDVDGFQNVIHSVTFPEQKNGKWTTSIDFGTAPIRAFKELLTIFSAEGVNRIDVHSNSFKKE